MRKNGKKLLREFLNLPTHCHGANVRTAVKNTDGSNYGIEINDCGNRVYLHGKFETKDDFENAMHKIDTLTNVLQQTKQNIIESRAELLAEKAKKRQTAKAKKGTHSQNETIS
jgi:hypothetical protein